VKIIRS